MTDNPPKIDNAPGLAWKPRVNGWEARWQARTDLVQKGYAPKSWALWMGTGAPSPADAMAIALTCQRMQEDMLAWHRSTMLPVNPSKFDGSLRSLIAAYETDEDSRFSKIRHVTRMNQLRQMARLMREYGHIEIKDLKARDLLRWHEVWQTGGKTATAHSLVGMLRTIFKFGATILEEAECQRVKGLLHDLRFPQGKPRDKWLTAEMAIAVCIQAHAMGRPSIALAQAFQFECTLRQKDVIGEWLPMSEPEFSTYTNGNEKWLRGLRWEEITATPNGLVLKHMTSKKNKEIVINLNFAPMVMEEIEKQFPDGLPTEGPIVIQEQFGIPWHHWEFRRQWRKAATAAGVPKGIYNMDSRAGAITEATDAGAQLEDVRHAATHGDVAMTQRYSRGSVDKVAKVMQLRVEKRGTERKPNE